MAHEPTPLPGSAQHSDPGARGLGREQSGQHVIVIGHDDVQVGLPSGGKAEEIHDERGVHHLLAPLAMPLAPPAIHRPQRVQQVEIVPAGQPARNAGQSGAQPNCVRTTEEGHAIPTVRPCSSAVRVSDLDDSLKMRSRRCSRMPTPVQPQSDLVSRPGRGFHEVVGNDALDVLEGRPGDRGRPLAASRRTGRDHCRVPIDETDGPGESPGQGRPFRHLRKRPVTAYTAPPPRRAGTSTAAGSGVKSSPGLMKRLRSRPYCLS